MMINKMTLSLNQAQSSVLNYPFWTNYLGLGRSLIALGTLLTLLFNSNEVLFSYGINNEEFVKCNGMNSFSLYCLIQNVTLVKTFSILVLTSVFIGIYPRITCFFHWWVTYSFVTSSYIVDGGDQIASILSLLLIPICLFDKRKWHWKIDEFKHPEYEKIIAFLFYLLITIQVFIIYFHAAVGKFKVEEWVNGTSVYYWVTNPVFGMNGSLLEIITPILQSPFLIVMITWGVLILELFLASCFFIKNEKIKKIAFVLGLIFHFAIIIVHGLISFFFSMAGALTLYLMAKNKNYVRNRDS